MVLYIFSKELSLYYKNKAKICMLLYLTTVNLLISFQARKSISRYTGKCV